MQQIFETELACLLQVQTCKPISMPVGILRPEWLAGSTYLGEETIDSFRCYKWTKADFIDYWADKVTCFFMRSFQVPPLCVELAYLSMYRSEMKQ
jgi:hypothetical protein